MCCSDSGLVFRVPRDRFFVNHTSKFVTFGTLVQSFYDENRLDLQPIATVDLSADLDLVIYPL